MNVPANEMEVILTANRSPENNSGDFTLVDYLQEKKEANTEAEKPYLPSTHLVYAGDYAKSAASSIFSTAFCGAKFAAYSVGALGQFAIGGLSSWWEDGSYAKRAVDNGANTVTEGFKSVGNTIGAVYELAAAGTLAATPYVKTAAEYTMNLVGAAVISGLDYAFNGDDQPSVEYEMTTYSDNSSEGFLGDIFGSSDPDDLFNSGPISLLGAAASLFADEEDADLFG